MVKQVYEIVEHDGGWAYKVDGTFSETFRTHDAALAAARNAAAEQRVGDETDGISYETADGVWHDEVVGWRRPSRHGRQRSVHPVGTRSLGGQCPISGPGRAAACIPAGRTAPPAAARGCRATACRRRAAPGPSSSRLAQAEEAAAGLRLGLADQHLVVGRCRGWAAGVSWRRGSACLRCAIASTAARRRCRRRRGTGCRSRAAASARP